MTEQSRAVGNEQDEEPRVVDGLGNGLRGSCKRDPDRRTRGGTPLETFAERKNVLGVSEGTLVIINRCLAGDGLIEKEGVRNYVRRDAKLSVAILAAARALAEAADREGVDVRHAMLAALSFSTRDEPDTDERWDLEEHGLHADRD